VRGILILSNRFIWKSNTNLKGLGTWRFNISVEYIIKEDRREGVSSNIERKVNIGLIIGGIVFVTIAYY
jgi:hypothetical protein